MHGLQSVILRCEAAPQTSSLSLSLASVCRQEATDDTSSAVHRFPYFREANSRQLAGFMPSCIGSSFNTLAWTTRHAIQTPLLLVLDSRRQMETRQVAV